MYKRQYPDRAEVFNNRAKLYYLMCSYENALQDIKYANVLYPDCAMILFNKGKIECRLHLYTEAIAVSYTHLDVYKRQIIMV